MFCHQLYEKLESIMKTFSPGKRIQPTIGTPNLRKREIFSRLPWPKYFRSFVLYAIMREAAAHLETHILPFKHLLDQMFPAMPKATEH